MAELSIDLGMVIQLVINDDLELDVSEEVYRSVRGEGDNRGGFNMNADIGYYASQKIQENLLNRGISKDQIKIVGNSIHVKVKTGEVA